MKVLAVLVLLAVVGCTNEDHATRALRGAGYTDVAFTGYRLFMCSEDDMFATGFQAIGPTGQRVAGVVCSGFLKGATIRAD